MSSLFRRDCFRLAYYIEFQPNFRLNFGLKFRLKFQTKSRPIMSAAFLGIPSRTAQRHFFPRRSPLNDSPKKKTPPALPEAFRENLLRKIRPQNYCSFGLAGGLAAGLAAAGAAPVFTGYA